MNKDTNTGNQTMVYPNVLEASKADLFFGGVFDAVHDNIVNCDVEMVCVGQEEENSGSHDDSEYGDDSTTTHATNSNSRSSNTTTMTTTSTNMFNTLAEVDVVKIPTEMEEDKIRRREAMMRMTRPNMHGPPRYCLSQALALTQKSGRVIGSEEEDDDDGSSAAEDDNGPVNTIHPPNAATDIKTAEVLGCELSDADVLCGRRCADLRTPLQINGCVN